jgi:acyl carrier protein
MDPLVEELKTKTLALLNLTHVDPAQVTPDTPLFADGLGLDSIDALELVMLLEQDYQVTVDNKELGRRVLASFGTMAAFIRERQAAAS